MFPCHLSRSQSHLFVSLLFIYSYFSTCRGLNSWLQDWVTLHPLSLPGATAHPDFPGIIWCLALLNWDLFWATSACGLRDKRFCSHFPRKAGVSAVFWAKSLGLWAHHPFSFASAARLEADASCPFPLFWGMVHRALSPHPTARKPFSSTSGVHGWSLVI